MGEARYLIDKLLNLSLSQSYASVQRELVIQERETELEQIKEDHRMVNQLLEYMLQQSDGKGERTRQISYQESSCSSSRSGSPSILEMSSSGTGSTTGLKNKARQRTAVSREVLLGMKTSDDSGACTSSSLLGQGQHLEASII